MTHYYFHSLDYVPEADPMAEEYEPLILEDNILVEGADIESALLDPLDAPIAGGIVVDPTLPNDPEVDTSAFDQVVNDYIAANNITLAGDSTTDPNVDPTAGGAAPPITTTPAPPVPDGGVADGVVADGGVAAPPITTTLAPPTYDDGDDDYVATLGILEGARELPTFNCTGLTGYNCCLMIKVRIYISCY